MITSKTAQALNRYFESLRVLGYRKNCDVRKLLVLVFVEEILTGDMSEFVSPEDISVFNSVLDCISGDCLIDRMSIGSSMCFNSPYNISSGSC